MYFTNERNPILAGLLSLFMGPFGYAYIGLDYMMSGIIISVIFNLLLSLTTGLQLPQSFIIIQFFVYAYCGHKYAIYRNAMEFFTKDTVKEKFGLNEFGFTLTMTMPLLKRLIMSYSLIIGFYFVKINFNNEEYINATLIILIGIPIAFWGLSFVLIQILSYLIILFFSKQKN